MAGAPTLSDALSFRVFIASPGDLENERTVVRQCIAEHNRGLDRQHGATFVDVGWESVRGTARRPQEAINELIGECHFMVALFKKSWGSEPGSPWGFTSGSEEELFTALLALGEEEHPMRDVWIGFVEADDPAPEIEALQGQMKKNHTMLYEVINDLADLKTKLSARLSGWSADIDAKKSPRHVNLLPTSGMDILRAASLSRDGNKLVSLGQPDAGREKLKEASTLGGPPENLAYARFLARQNEMAAAELVVQTAIDYFTTGQGPLSSPLAAESFAELAGLLRRQGRGDAAVGRLNQALTLFEDTNPLALKLRARILDELGLSYMQIHERSKARASFDQSLNLRERVPDDAGVAQSLVNLTRLNLAEGLIDEATASTTRILEILNRLPESVLHANAYVCVAQVLIRVNRFQEAEHYSTKAVVLNEQFGSRRGEAISHFVAAEAAHGSGDVASALHHAQMSLQINDSMGLDFGRSRARGLLEKLAEVD